MTWVLLALGLVMVVEGLAFALAPLRMQEALRRLAEMPQGQRRVMGLAVLALGVALVWLARAWSAVG